MWNSIIEMLSSLNENCDYVVLRNYEQFEEQKLISGHEDIDLLCNNAEKVINILHAENKIQGDNVHLKINICNKKIDLDLRCVGDGYYDKKWELNMLEKKK